MPAVVVRVKNGQVTTKIGDKLVLQHARHAQHVLGHGIVRFGSTRLCCLERVAYMHLGTQKGGEVKSLPERSSTRGSLAALLNLVHVLEDSIRVHVGPHASEERKAHSCKQNRLDRWKGAAEAKQGDQGDLGADRLMAD